MDRQENVQQNKKNEIIKLQIILSRILWFLSPFMAYFILQRFYGTGIRAFLQTIPTRRGLLNIFILYTFLWGCYVIINRTKVSAVLTVLAAFILGLTNYFVWEFRGTPLVVADIMSAGTAMEVAGGYQYTLNTNARSCVVCMILYILAVFVLKSGKGLRWKQRIAAAASFLVLVSGFHHLFFKSNYLEKHGIIGDIFNGVDNYTENGTALSMMLSWSYYMVDKPDGYSPSKVEKLAENYKSDPAVGAEDKKPNVIVVMNESFADLNTVGDLPLSEDAMPFVHSLTENTVKGNLYVSTKGGGTANTEFEFLTGSSMAFLPYRSIPYNSYITEKLPSFCTTLSSQGYGGNLAFHPFYSNPWKREKVYPLLGFSDFISMEDMPDDEKEYVRSFISDECDYEKLISLYEEFKKSEAKELPFYVFNVTIQNHGGYDSSEMADEDMVLTITDEKLKNDKAETYLNLIRKSDQALEKLVEYFEKVEEPTLLVFFGDHQPGISTEFYFDLAGNQSGYLTLEESINQFEVPYMIWANYDIQEEKRDMSVNYLGAYVLKTAGLNLTGYQKYLLELMEKVPVVTQNGYMGEDGMIHSLKEESEYSSLLEEYAAIQYNYLIDKKNRVETFFELENVKEE